MPDKTRGFKPRLLVFLLVLFVPSAAARAQGEGNPANWCRNGAFTDSSAGFRLARVTGAKNERAYFYSDEEGCPSMSERCRKKAYVIPGDELIAVHSFGDWACVWYQPAKGAETVGWMPEHRLSFSEPDKSPPAARWLGDWEFYKNSLEVRRGSRAGGLSVKGTAIWLGLNDNVHTGVLDSQVKPEGNVIRIDDGICQARLTLVGAYLVVDDNNDCGGANVTFDGVYRRKAAPRARR